VSIRARLTLWFVAAMAALVVLTSVTTYLIVRSRLETQTASSAAALARAAASAETDEASLNKVAGPGDRIWLTDATGNVVASSVGAGESPATVKQILSHPPSGYTVAQAPRPEGGRAIVAVGNRALERTLSTLGRTLLLVDIFVLVLTAAVGSLLAARALRPVERLRREVDSIPGEALDRRVAEGRPDELGRLARAFNRLLTRADRAAEEQRRFVADASHELKTPVTALQGHAHIAARAAERGDLARTQESSRIVEEQARRLAGIVRELLALAESGAGEPRREPLRLDRVVADACDELRLAHPDRALELALVPATVTGDPARLSELVRVLVDNALKYSPRTAPVEVCVVDGGPPSVAIRDRGAGLTAADHARAFDRFYRGEAASGVTGSGLGLAIARAIADSHGATVELADAPGGGTLATVTFAGGGLTP
jgi:signal transduction histidine kinase